MEVNSAKTEQEVRDLIANGEQRQQQGQLSSLVSELKRRFGNVSVGPFDKDQSRLPQEDVVLDLDILGLTPMRPPREQPPRNPDYAALPVPRSQYVSQAAKLPSALDRGSFTVGDPGGLVEEGNIDLGARKQVDNDDGTFSTVVSKSFEMDGFEVLVPTLDPDGNPLSDQQAVDRFMETGEHLGKFDTPESATAYARRLSEAQNPNIPRDPDHYIDLGSERWRDVFIRAPQVPRPTRSLKVERSPTRPKPRPKSTPEQRTRMLNGVRSGAQGPTFQPTRTPNASK